MTPISRACAGLVAGLGLVLITSVSALAGGYEYGAVVKHRVPAAVPVPAPAPIPDEMSNWYVRVDAAYAFSNISSYSAQAPWNDDAFRSDQRLDQFARFGIGAGYHFTNWLRGDITIDTRTDVKSHGRGTIATPDGTGEIRDTYEDDFRTRNWTALANLYYDLPTWRSFRPYIGAGVGFVVHSSNGRTFTHTRTCSAGTVNCAAGSDVANGSMPSDVAFAWAIMTGASWKVTRNGSLDFGYRYLNLGGTTLSTGFTTGGSRIPARMKIPDQDQHEIRVGYRVDIN